MKGDQTAAVGHWWDGEGGQHHIQVFKSLHNQIYQTRVMLYSIKFILYTNVYHLQIVSNEFKSSPNQIYWTSVMLYMYQYIYNVWFISSYYKFSEAAILVFSLDNPVRQAFKFYRYFSHKNKYFQIFAFFLQKIQLLNIQDTFHILSQHLLDIVTYAENAKIFLWVWILRNM